MISSCLWDQNRIFLTRRWEFIHTLKRRHVGGDRTRYFSEVKMFSTDTNMFNKTSGHFLVNIWGNKSEYFQQNIWNVSS